MAENLTPEDIQLMKDAIAQYEGAESAPAMEANPDEAADRAGDASQDREMLQAIVSALEVVIDELENLKACHEDLERIVKEEIIGGVTKLYHESERLDGISGIKSKYGNELSQYEEVFRALNDDPNADIYSKLYDKLQELKSGEGYDESQEGTYVQDLIGRLKSAAPAPAAPSIEVAVEKPVEEPPVDEQEALVTKLKAMKSKARGTGY